MKQSRHDVKLELNAKLAFRWVIKLRISCFNMKYLKEQRATHDVAL
jgi:hypothetical protein